MTPEVAGWVAAIKSRMEIWIRHSSFSSLPWVRSFRKQSQTLNHVYLYLSANKTVHLYCVWSKTHPTNHIELVFVRVVLRWCAIGVIRKIGSSRRDRFPVFSLGHSDCLKHDRGRHNLLENGQCTQKVNEISAIQQLLPSWQRQRGKDWFASRF